MKILIANAFESTGGAARAAQRLHQGLLLEGVEADFLVAKRSSEKKRVVSLWPKFAQPMATFFCFADLLPLLLYPKRQKVVFSPAVAPSFLSSFINRLNPDLVHLHWINYGMTNIEDITKIKAPIVWTLHDSWAFTGGCHLPFDCKRYQESCGTCPELDSTNPEDLSRKIWKRKAKAWPRLNLQVVTPSQWLAGCARSSSLFKNRPISVIPNSVDTDLYQPKDSLPARLQFGLPKNKKLILLGGMQVNQDINKGFQFLKPIQQYLKQQNHKDIEFVILGSKQTSIDIAAEFPIHFLGTFTNEAAVASLYSAVDVTLLLSLQENLPYSVMESLSCGKPVVAFNIGGVPEMIEHQKNGYLARPYETEDIVAGLSWIFADPGRYEELCRNARQKCLNDYTLKKQAQSYQKLYTNILG